MNWELLISLVQAAAPLAGVAVAGLAIWVTHGERTSSYRTSLYDEQVKAYHELIPAVSEVCSILNMEAPDREAKARILECHAEYCRSVFRWWPFLPASVNDALSRLTVTCNEFMVPCSEQHDWQSMRKRLLSEDGGLITEVRNALHTDPLTGETAAVMPKMKFGVAEQQGSKEA